MNIAALQRLLRQKHLSAAVFVALEHGDVDIQYFSGYAGSGLFCVPADKKPFLIVPELEFERAKRSKVKALLWPRKKKLFETLATLVKGRIGMDFHATSAFLFSAARKRFKIEDINEDLLEIRCEKTAWELTRLKKACKIADEILDACVKRFREFKTEKEVAKFLELETVKRGCGLAFPVIVASGKAASMPHYEPQNVPIKKGFCVIDFGVTVEGYHSDITRTIYVGKPSKEEMALYYLVENAQLAAKNLIAEEKDCKKIHQFVERALGDKAKYFIHSLGHGIGLEVHECPGLGPYSKRRLTQNMVFTLEPGIYLPGKLGIRIEGDFLLTKGKAVALTRSTGLVCV